MDRSHCADRSLFCARLLYPVEVHGLTSSELRKHLETKVLIGDGAMGTYLASLCGDRSEPVELLNLTSPELVASAHRDYVGAGARLIETNTFAANRCYLGRFGAADQVKQINAAGVRAAKGAAGEGILVGGAVGPVSASGFAPSSIDELRDVYREQMTALLESGVDLLILETFSDLYELQIALETARSLCDVAVICQMTVVSGAGRAELGRLRRLAELIDEGAAVVGVNCSGGPSVVSEAVSELVKLVDAPVSAFPNASIPETVGGRSLYSADPSYFGSCAVRCAEAGAAIVGGCCGTTPDHIRHLAQCVEQSGLLSRTRTFSLALKLKSRDSSSQPAAAFVEKAKTGRRSVIVELDPPKTWSLSALVHTAKCLARDGVDAFSVPENPGARVRMDSLVAGYVLQRETGVPAIVHMTCRDRSLIGQHSRILGLAAMDITAVLAVTGDRPGDQRDQIGRKVSGMYETGSYGLIELIQGYNTSPDAPYRISIGCAFNANAVHLDLEVNRLRRKIELGVDFVQTQPVWTPSAVYELRDRLGDIGVPVFIGVLPFVSLRNAEVLSNEFPGMRIPQEIMSLLRRAAPDQVREVGLELAKQVVEAALRCFSGVYIIPPFNRLEVASPLVRHALSFSKQQ